MIGNPLYSSPDYGSRLRDGAGVLALGVETQMPAAEILRISKVVKDARANTSFSSTQENAFMVLAAEALADKTETIALSIDGVAHGAPTLRCSRARQDCHVANNGQFLVSEF
jgi:uncharacterized protein YfaS (alpha-2-macroglobulin family)